VKSKIQIAVSFWHFEFHGVIFYAAVKFGEIIKMHWHRFPVLALIAVSYRLTHILILLACSFTPYNQI
jgi:hypothetical protein